MEKEWWKKDKPQWHEENQQDPPADLSLAEQKRIEEERRSVKERYQEEKKAEDSSASGHRLLENRGPVVVAGVAVVLVIGVMLIGLSLIHI